MFRVLHMVLANVVVDGDLTVIDADGCKIRFGDGTSPHVTVRIADAGAERAIAFDPLLALGETYMQGRLIVEDGTIYDLIAILMRGAQTSGMAGGSRWRQALRKALRRLKQFNPPTRSRRNVAHHYDIDGGIYDLFLDADRQYSCGYFSPGADLDEAQLAKKRHLAAKLAVTAGNRVLDIGCGWGGLALYLAKLCEAEVTGVTLSREQLAIARQRAAAEGLSSLVEFRLQDYRQIDARFDRIVSVGMFEHVGVNHYSAYFAQIASLLAEDGIAVVHSIGRSDGPGYTNPFIEKYIFPGGYFPALSEVLPAVEQSGLILADVEILRLHYAETLKAWRERFLAHRAAAVALRGEGFARMWEFYLAGSEAGFRFQGLVVFQLQLAKRIDTLPLTRDYMTETEQRLRMCETGPSGQRMAGE